jgi:hypothetical protein
MAPALLKIEPKLYKVKKTIKIQEKLKQEIKKYVQNIETKTS